MLIMNARVLEIHHDTACSIWDEWEGILYYSGKRGWLLAFRGGLWVIENSIQDEFYRGYPWMDWAVSRPTFEFSYHDKDAPPVVWFRRYVFSRSGMALSRSMVASTVRLATRLLLRLQRWFRCQNTLSARKRLALVMAFHPRLGSGSPLAALDQDLVRSLVLRRGRDGSARRT
jgi:hypothetical protein